MTTQQEVRDDRRTIMPRINKANLAVTGAASTDKNRYNLCTVLVQNDCTVATDGHMLAKVTTPSQTEEDCPTDDGVLVLLADMKQADKATLKGGDLIVEDAESELRLRAGGTTLTTQPAEGMFPDYKQVIPTGTPEYQATFDAHLLSKAFAIAAKAINARQAVVTLAFTDAKAPVKITGTNQETGQTVEVVVMPCRAS